MSCRVSPDRRNAHERASATRFGEELQAAAANRSGDPHRICGPRQDAVQRRRTAASWLTRWSCSALSFFICVELFRLSHVFTFRLSFFLLVYNVRDTLVALRKGGGAGGGGVGVREERTSDTIQTAHIHDTKLAHISCNTHTLLLSTQKRHEPSFLQEQYTRHKQLKETGALNTQNISAQHKRITSVQILADPYGIDLAGGPVKGSSMFEGTGRGVPDGAPSSRSSLPWQGANAGFARWPPRCWCCC